MADPSQMSNGANGDVLMADGPARNPAILPTTSSATPATTTTNAVPSPLRNVTTDPSTTTTLSDAHQRQLTPQAKPSSRATSVHPPSDRQQPTQQQQQQPLQPQQPPFEMPSETPPHGAPVRQYLNAKVTPFLLEGMKIVARDQPKDPLRTLGEFFLAKSKELEGNAGPMAAAPATSQE